MMLHDYLDETYHLLRDSIRQFAKREIAPLAKTLDERDEFPRQLWPKLGEMGILGITVKPQFGGSDMGYLAHVIVMEEISRACAAIGLSYGAHSNLCMNQLQRHGNEQQQHTYLPGLARGEKIGALAISEPNAGSDSVGMSLQATVCEGGYLLNGNKMWITNGLDADVIIVYAKTDVSRGKHGISAFIVEKSFAGFTCAQKLDKLGMRGSDTCELVFRDCYVPQANLLGELHQGVAVLMSGLDYERVVLAGGPVGIMQACLDVMLPYIHERQQFGQPIGEFQLVQAMVADVYTSLQAARSYVYAAAQACDNGGITREAAASCILFAAEQATHAALKAMQCLGGNGYINEYPTGRLLRDAKLYEIGAGTSEIRRLLIGRQLYNASA